eukprot:jgi/Astpho2/6214/Aster-03621
MAAKVAGLIKLALPAGKANPAPPVGPALGAKVGLVERVASAAQRGRPLAGSWTYIAQPAASEQHSMAPSVCRYDLHQVCLCCAAQGVNIMAFCKEYNARTQDKTGTIIPVEITVFDGRNSPVPAASHLTASASISAQCSLYFAGMLLPALQDRSFTFILKTPPASVLLAKAAGIEKGSGTPNTQKVGKVSQAQLKEIAETKLPDLNCTNVEAAMRIIEGTAKNMGLTVEAPNDPEAATAPMAA